jgi:hypothetical protein
LLTLPPESELELSAQPVARSTKQQEARKSMGVFMDKRRVAETAREKNTAGNIIKFLFDSNTPHYRGRQADRPDLATQSPFNRCNVYHLFTQVTSRRAQKNESDGWSSALTQP